MRKHLFLYFFLVPMLISAQIQVDSLSQGAHDEQLSDSVRFEAMLTLANYYQTRQPDSALYFAEWLYSLTKDIEGREITSTYALNQIGQYYTRKGDHANAITHFQRSLEIAESLNHLASIAMSLSYTSNAYRSQGNYAEALSYSLRSLEINQAIGNDMNIAKSFTIIGLTYNKLGDYAKALDYFQQSIDILGPLGDQSVTASVLTNIANIYSQQGNDSLALAHYQRSLEVFEAVGHQVGKSACLGNIGDIYLKQGNYPQALVYFQRGLEIAESIGQPYYIASILSNIGIIYQREGDYSQALRYGEKAFRVAQKTGSVSLIESTTKPLWQTYKALKQPQKALDMHELYTQMRDSLYSIESQRATIRYEYEMQATADSVAFAKAAEIKDLKIARQETRIGLQRIVLLTVIIALIIIGVLAYSIFQSKKRSEELLLNILPAETAAELKAKGYATAKEYEQVSILFSDFVGFTQLAESLNASDLVAEIDTCFKAFDQIITQYGLEKIKTIGDAYMAAGGLPDPFSASAKDVVHAGLAMQQFIAARKAEREAQGLLFFEMRVGVHTGPAIAGVVGVKKFQYDIWGDTVNTAARIEQNGKVGQVNISEPTHNLLQTEPDLSFEARGTIEVKGKGMMEMYFVSFV